MRGWMYLEWISMGEWYIYVSYPILIFTINIQANAGIMVNIHNHLMDVMGVVEKTTNWKEILPWKLTPATWKPQIEKENHLPLHPHSCWGSMLVFWGVNEVHLTFKLLEDLTLQSHFFIQYFMDLILIKRTLQLLTTLEDRLDEFFDRRLW